MLSTRKAYEAYIRRVIKPGLGHLQVLKIRGPLLDMLYAPAALQRSRAHRQAIHRAPERARALGCSGPPAAGLPGSR